MTETDSKIFIFFKRGFPRRNKMFKREKVNKEHILSLTDGKDYGLCSPPMEAQVAVNELCRYFLGEDWYSVMPQSGEQVNTEIVYAIECNYKGKRNPRG